MTNKDKFLRDGVSVEEFVNEFHNFCAKQNNNNASSIRPEQFLSRKATPTLTEDEKVILRNMKCFGEIVRTIERDKKGDLLVLSCNFSNYITMYDHLFQFIKERRRI